MEHPKWSFVALEFPYPFADLFFLYCIVLYCIVLHIVINDVTNAHNTVGEIEARYNKTTNA